jgi:hypothetical protein
MQRDLVLRWLEQLSLLIRRLLYGPGPVDIELAEHRIAEAMQQHLGPLALLVPRLDPLSAANLLHDPDRILGYAELVGLEALIREKKGEDATALREREAALRAVGMEKEKGEGRKEK